MEDSLKDDSPHRGDNNKKDFLGHNTNSYTTHTTHTTLHEERKPIQIRMRQSVHDSVGRYCGKEMTYGQFYEEAAMLFMDVNPKPLPHNITLVRLERHDQGFEDSLQEMIVVDELEELLGKLRLVNGKIHRTRKKDFLGIVKEYKKVKTPSENLQTLMREAKSYFD